MTAAATATSSRVRLWWLACGAGAAAGAGLLVGSLLGDFNIRTPLSGLPETSAGVQVSLPIVRTVWYLEAVVTVGFLLAAAALLPSAKHLLATASARAARIAGASASMWAATSILLVILSFAETFASPFTGALHPRQLWGYLLGSEQGAAFMIAGIFAVLTAAIALSVNTPLGAWLALGMAIAATLPPAFTGHAAAARNHDLATSSIVVHAVAVTLWVGGLLALVWYAHADGRHLPLATRRFSVIALYLYLAVGLSGAFSALLRIDSFGDLTSSRYGVLILIKISAFTALGVLGWAHRRVLLPRLARGEPRSFVRLALVEAGVMLATVGIAVALAATPPPEVDQVRTPNAAEIALGFPLPGPPSVTAILTSWRPDLLILTTLVTAAALYAVGVTRLRTRGHSWPLTRIASWYAGLAVLAVGSLSGLSAYGRVSFSLHMVQHMTLSMVAPLLLVLAAPITLALRALPAAPHRQPAGAREWLLSALQSTPARVITHPVTALAMFVTAPYLIYFSDLFEVALRNHWAHLLMHAHFVVIGYLFYQSLVGVDPVPYRFPYPLRLVSLMLALASHSFFAVALMSSNAVIAGDFLEGLDRPWWPNLLQEQTNGAGFAWAFGEVPGVLVLVALLFRWSRHDERRAHQLDRAADRNSDAELAAYNAMLAERANRRGT
ncbi:MAG: bifunctional copper resistance protein CopD/cytochrome c oxidase assembly protein [Anaerolineae bacterium]|nr:bifunctional copper resistance protein CopD/cytochrome c oxidase assembly protein [Anaerolineae bacterium]